MKHSKVWVLKSHLIYQIGITWERSNINQRLIKWKEKNQSITMISLIVLKRMLLYIVGVFWKTVLKQLLHWEVNFGQDITHIIRYAQTYLDQSILEMELEAMICHSWFDIPWLWWWLTEKSAVNKQV